MVYNLEKKEDMHIIELDIGKIRKFCGERLQSGMV